MDKTEDSAQDLRSEIIAEAASGSRAAQQRVLETQYDFVRRMLYRLAGPGPDLEDLQQVVLLRILTSLPNYRGESAFSTWVAGMCVNVCRDHWRRKRVRSVVAHEDRVDRYRGDTAGPDVVVSERQELRHAFEALERLSDNQRAAFVLRHVYGYSVDEVAKAMGAANSTTRLRLYYGKKAFRRALEETQRAPMATPAVDSGDPIR